MKAIITDNPPQKELITFLKKTQDSLIYHHPDYLKMIVNHLNAKSSWVLVYDNNKITSALPFAYKETPLGTVINSLPYYGSIGSVISINDNPFNINEIFKSLFDWAANKKNILSITIVCNPLKTNEALIKKIVNPDHIDTRIGQITHLPSNKNIDPITLFDNPRPRNIRKAIKEGVVVKIHNEKSLDFLFKTHVENIESIGGIAKKESFFNSIENYMKTDNWRIYTAYIQNKPISALLLFYFNKTVEYFTPATLHEYRHIQPSSLIIYEAMKDSIKDDFKYWNWGGTWTTQKGVYDFKKKWGAEDHKYLYFTKILDNKIYNYKKEEILDIFEGFYVLPFNELK